MFDGFTQLVFHLVHALHFLAVWSAVNERNPDHESLLHWTVRCLEVYASYHPCLADHKQRQAMDKKMISTLESANRPFDHALNSPSNVVP
jgi:hypothetical protein